MAKVYDSTGGYYDTTRSIYVPAVAKPKVAPPPATNGLYGTLDPGIASQLIAGGQTVPSSYQPQTDSTPAPPPIPTAPPPNPTADVDWADVYFGQYGLPSDLKAQIMALGQKYGSSNPDVFYQSAQNLIRQSDWFQQTYPGFNSGVRAGLFTDETGYRGYVNQLNDIYQQYTGRSVTGAETSNALQSGLSPSYIGQQFQGQAYIGANQDQIQYLSGAFGGGQLSQSELASLGNEQAGIDTPQGQRFQTALQRAQQRLQGIFSGALATPSLSLSTGRLSAPSLVRNPDVAA
jgi:hypothetical protein